MLDAFLHKWQFNETPQTPQINVASATEVYLGWLLYFEMLEDNNMFYVHVLGQEKCKI